MQFLVEERGKQEQLPKKAVPTDKTRREGGAIAQRGDCSFVRQTSTGLGKAKK